MKAIDRASHISEKKVLLEVIQSDLYECVIPDYPIENVQNQFDSVLHCILRNQY